jgi:hypothetical protein
MYCDAYRERGSDGEREREREGGDTQACEERGHGKKRVSKIHCEDIGLYMPL